MAEAILAHKGARTLLELPGRSEVSVFATDPDTGVECKARFDRLTDDHALAVDVKTTAGRADPVSFGREAARFGYPVQEAHYANVFEWETGTRVPVLWIVTEKSAPHLVAVHEFSEVARLVARGLTARARQTYAECMATDVWPGYADETYTTDLPAWWHYEADDDMEIEF